MSKLGGKGMSEDTDVINLGVVDNTSDANKPVSAAQQAALDLKTDKTSTSNVDNTSDANKPVSTAQQAALNIMTKVEFDAQRESDKSRFNGSGEDSNIEFGTAYSLPATVANQFTIEAAVKYIDGIRSVMPQTVITLPDAPDGLDKSDGTGRFTDLAAAVTAGGTGLTASIITRQDLILARVVLSNYSGSNIAVEQNPDSNIYADAGTLKQYTASYIVEHGLRDYTDLSDAMTAFGYTLDATDKGLWTDGTDLFIPITLVQHRNQGAYHPTYNPYGSRKTNSNTGAASGGFWYQTISLVPSTVSECFNIIEGTSDNITAGAASLSGFLGSVSGRPDGKFYDAIYASDVQDLRMSARRVPYEELREKYKRKAIAGDVRGFECAIFTTIIPETQSSTDIAATAMAIANSSSYTVGNKCWLFNSNTLQILRIEISSLSTGVLTWLSSVWGTLSHTIGDIIYVLQETKQAYKQANPIGTDIMGNPINIAATFTGGISGQWIPTIPDGINDFFDLNRKGTKSGSASRTYTNDNGATWVNNTSLTFDTLLNRTQFDNMPATQVMLYNYETQAHFTEAAVTSSVLNLGVVRWDRGDNRIVNGNILQSSLIEKVGIASNDSRTTSELTLQNIRYTSDNTRRLLADPNAASTHDISNFIVPSNSSPAVKTLDYLSHSNNVARLYYVYKEMIYDGTWGDNNKFEVVDNQSVLTDDNGNTVKYGTACFDIPYFTME